MFVFAGHLLRELSQIMFAFFAICWPRTYSSLHFYSSKFYIFLTTYPSLNANVIYESFLSLWKAQND
jgi:hypothetical protein